MAALPGVAALITVVVSLVSIRATISATNGQLRISNGQLRISEQRQITDRYNAAVTNLGSRSIDIRLGGIYALQRLMYDSPRDQSTIIAVLCAFVRDQSASIKKPPKSSFSLPPADIQAALTVVGTRNAANDGHTTVIDFDRAQLANAIIGHDNLTGATFVAANLSGAWLTRASLHGATLGGADLSGAHLTGADLTGAGFRQANLAHAQLDRANLSHAKLALANLTGVNIPFGGVNKSSANLAGADLYKATP